MPTRKSALVLAGLLAAAHASSRCYYGAPCFPTPAELHAFNRTVGGRLVAVRPLQAVCYRGPAFDAAACAEVNAHYTDDIYRTDHIAAYELINFEQCGTSDRCQPATLGIGLTGTCAQGAVPRYGIAARSAADIVAAVQFAKSKNLKVAIKNTGHDYTGRSSAKDSFVIWTHALVDTAYAAAFVPAGSPDAGVPAITLGAGVQFDQVYRFADAHGVVVVGSESGQVGTVGGWLQGGGHGTLTPRYGLGADNVLELELVTADGRLRTVSAHSGADLFWALRGGGGGTWGVVTRATFRAYPSEPLAGVSITATGIALSAPELQRLLEALARAAPALADIRFGGVIVAGRTLFELSGAAPAAAAPRLQAALAPLAAALANGSITANHTLIRSGVLVPRYATWPSFLAFYEKFYAAPTQPVGVGVRVASRLIPRTHFASPANIRALAAALLAAAAATGQPVQILAAAPVGVPDTARETSVTPAWRGALWHAMVFGVWARGAGAGVQRAAAAGVDRATAVLAALAPESGTYQNEANVDEPDWERTFWGDNVQRLKAVKRKYDPDNFFAVWHGVGWEGRRDADFVCYDKYD
ncbi:hypothetical protein HWV62_20522 [Athelia sp. TMB]|nr:hypothetical protein HWV62_20522 [Athelia sp. TMB]